MSRSDANKVTLQDIGRQPPAFYRCEVSADAPTFHTGLQTGLLTVVGEYRVPHTSHPFSSHPSPHTPHFTPVSSHLTPLTSHPIYHTSRFTTHTKAPMHQSAVYPFATAERMRLPRTFIFPLFAATRATSQSLHAVRCGVQISRQEIRSAPINLS